MYLEQALAQYGKKRTTIAQMREDIKEFDSPIFVEALSSVCFWKFNFMEVYLSTRTNFLC